MPFKTLAELAKIQTVGHLAQNTELSSFQTTVMCKLMTRFISSLSISRLEIRAKTPRGPEPVWRSQGNATIHTLSNGKRNMEGTKKWNSNTLKWKN